MKKTNLQVLCLLLAMLTFQACTTDTANNSNSDTSTTTTTKEPGEKAPADDQDDFDNAEYEEDEKEEEEEEPVYEEPQPIVAKDFLYTWVDKLNIREKPSLKGKVITTVDSKEAVEVLEDKTGERTTFVLRGGAYEDHWYKVKTKDGTEGWIFGGAVRHKDEKKGNELMNDEKFDFPYFGKFDLSTWKNLGTKKESGDAESKFVTTTYQKGNRFLEIRKMTQGQDYFSNSFKLMDRKRKMLKEREFRVLMYSGGEDEIYEKVRDFTSSPMKDHIRSQKINVHFKELNALPMMALAPWESVRIEANANEIAALYKGIKSGTTLELKELFYHLTEPIDIRDMKDFTLEGNGASIIMRDPIANVVMIDASSNINIKFLRATHEDPEGHTGCTGNVIRVENCKKVSIENCSLNGSGIVGVVGYSTSDLRVEDCYIHENTKYGVLFDDATTIHIKSNTFENNGADGEAHVAKDPDGSASKIELIKGDVSEGNLKMTYNYYGEDDI